MQQAGGDTEEEVGLERVASTTGQAVFIARADASPAGAWRANYAIATPMTGDGSNASLHEVQVFALHPVGSLQEVEANVPVSALRLVYRPKTSNGALTWSCTWYGWEEYNGAKPDGC